MKKNKLDKHLSAYSTAAGAVLLGAAGAEGTIQATTGLDLTVTTGTSPLSLDLNGAGGAELNFLLAVTDLSYFANADVAPQNGASIAFIANSAVNFTAGNAISAGLWANVQKSLFWDYAGSGFNKGGNFWNTPGYLGVRFDPLGGTDWKYGWVHIDSVTASFKSYSYHIDGYAYEDSGAPISAGAVPEPSSLALLAVGAAGVRLLRKRYDQV